MADDNNDTEKEFDATPQKLEEARKSGDVTRSQEAGAAIALGTLTVMIGAGAHTVAHPVRDLMVQLYSLEALRTLQAGGSVIPLVVVALAKALLPLLGAMATMGMFLQLAEMGFTLPSGEEAGLKVDFKRLDVVSNIKEKFGLKVVLDTVKNVLKLALVSIVVVASAYQVFEHLDGFLGLSPTALTTALADNVAVVLFRITLVALIIVAIDYAFERYRFLKKQRMSKQDIKDEMKNAEGDPQIKAARRRRAQEIASGKALGSVGEATVLVANPTHFSVTLRYEREADAAPIVLGKGKNRTALRMRELAREHGVPIVENKPLAQALFAIAKEGEPIPADLYRAVAEVLAYVLAPPGSGAVPPPPAEIPASALKAVQRLRADA